MSNPIFRDQARAFLIWRHAAPINWACTYADISRATDLPLGTVQRICKARGWKTRPGRDRYDQISWHNLPVDRFIASNSILTY